MLPASNYARSKLWRKDALENEGAVTVFSGRGNVPFLITLVIFCKISSLNSLETGEHVRAAALVTTINETKPLIKLICQEGYSWIESSSLAAFLSSRAHALMAGYVPSPFVTGETRKCSAKYQMENSGSVAPGERLWREA